MAHAHKYKEKRDEAILKEFNKLFGVKMFRHEACLKKLSDKFFLAPLTISRIINNQRGKQTK